MTRYLLLLIPFLLMRASTFLFAPFAVAFQQNYRLRWPFRWMDCVDNDLRGDGGHQERWPDFTAYPAMVIWMFRNGGNWASYWTFGWPGDGTTPFWSICTAPGWQWRLGWNPYDSKVGRTKFNFTVRYRP